MIHSESAIEVKAFVVIEANPLNSDSMWNVVGVAIKSIMFEQEKIQHVAHYLVKKAFMPNLVALLNENPFRELNKEYPKDVHNASEIFLIFDAGNNINNTTQHSRLFKHKVLDWPALVLHSMLSLQENQLFKIVEQTCGYEYHTDIDGNILWDAKTTISKNIRLNSVTEDQLVNSYITDSYFENGELVEMSEDDFDTEILQRELAKIPQVIFKKHPQGSYFSVNINMDDELKAHMNKVAATQKQINPYLLLVQQVVNDAFCAARR